ncbi:MAG TPA: hypothetical protein VJA16_04110 [Thermoanaerobaculia bacterium]
MTLILLIVAVGLGVYFAFEANVRRRRVATVIFWLALICVIPIWATSTSWGQVPALAVLCTLPFLPVMLLASYSVSPERRWLLAILVAFVFIAAFSVAAVLLVAYGAVVP